MTDDERERYLAELARLGAPEEVRDHFRRLAALGEIGNSPDEFRRFIRSIGTPQEISDRREAMNRLIETNRFHARIISSVKAIALWATAVIVAWAAFQGALSEFFSGMGK